MDRRSFLKGVGALFAAGTITPSIAKILVQEYPLPDGYIFLTRDGPMIYSQEGFLPCDGRLVSRKSYQALFQAIGYYYTDEDERCCTSELFRLPDMRARIV